ncbi:hypothetical protein ASG01_00805 [Chryseobacterium sp. Leaf180]|uniref:VOC family protein n=1 Tax=Chryseobacterium sp. Leaf180 TaxID=1736289 RepID=UPI0007002A83|nr:VOC family protein [Chryseobacterium sp. Leaf180]KQR94459.1 hypothetical protein ASG01_00805 [Chryseobacterium sp. Leaf180]
MNIEKTFSAVMTSDIESSKKWYSEVFGRIHDTHPMPSLYEWHFPDGGGMQLFEDKDRAGFSSVNFFVSDLQILKRDLNAKGIETEGINEGDFVKTMVIYDPENNRIAFAESKPSVSN